jgi:hypothetical protein
MTWRPASGFSALSAVFTADLSGYTERHKLDGGRFVCDGPDFVHDSQLTGYQWAASAAIFLSRPQERYAVLRHLGIWCPDLEPSSRAFFGCPATLAFFFIFNFFTCFIMGSSRTRGDGNVVRFVLRRLSSHRKEVPNLELCSGGRPVRVMWASRSRRPRAIPDTLITHRSVSRAKALGGTAPSSTLT